MMAKTRYRFNRMKAQRKLLVVPLLLLFFTSSAQQAYFVDGYHGGVYGHYPKGYTQFVVDKLQENPFWKINLEIEPETWDSVAVREPAALQELQRLFADQSTMGRIEYVSPAYGQSYLYTVSGESIIRQFDYGMRKVRQYFPGAVFTTYSSEEPCFTSALPQILTSFGYRYACLKNPNTCWGGYTRAFGGELVNWVGPDGTKLITVPRYATEGLLPNSTWQTEAWTNSPGYINQALQYGIKHPVAMTLQDAGWRNGPWIGNGHSGYQPTEYTTWRNYIGNASIKTPTQDWKFSQEDVLVSLVWGSQVLQKLAQQVRAAENHIVRAEKIGALVMVYQQASWPQQQLDQAWRPLLLAQHHDCWIVPYNGPRGNTWADKVVRWTGATNRFSDSVITQAFGAGRGATHVIRVYNSTGQTRREMVRLTLPPGTDAKAVRVVDTRNRAVLTQAAAAGSPADAAVYFEATVPAVGYNSYTLVSQPPAATRGAHASATTMGEVVLENDFYTIVLDKARGGVIKSLVAKKVGNKEIVDTKNERSFNEVRGNFFDNGGFHSTADKPATITILENGPAVVQAEIKGNLLSHPYTQTITLKQGDRKIECRLRIDWQENIGIGNAYKQHGGLEAKDYTKPFYDDSQKLLALFPVAFSASKIYKDAPFDVTESRLENTFFTRWDSIKNNIMLSWVDAYAAQQNLGLALLTDHTTTYAHGKDFPLGLNVQYSGVGLWGRNHTITGPTEIRYALVPHAGKWDEAQIAAEVQGWNEPLVASLTQPTKASRRSLVEVGATGWQVTTVLVDGADLLVRLFNAAGDAKPQKIIIGGSAVAADLVELNGAVKNPLTMQKNKSGTVVRVAMPRFGLRTIRLKNFQAN